MSKLDLVIFGATGFTGKLAALYAAKQYGRNIKWAIAGRSQQKLQAIQAECQGTSDVKTPHMMVWHNAILLEPKCIYIYIYYFVYYIVYQFCRKCT